MKAGRSNLGWLLVVNAAYALAALVGWPYYLFLLATRRKYRSHCWQRWGLVPRFPAGAKRLWVHAISVGEVEAARTFVPALAEAFPDHEIVISTTTMTGRERALRLFPDRPVFHFPLDLWPCVALALGRVRPAAVIQVESEWWPNFFLLAARRGIPLVVVNLRMTEHGQRGYRRIRSLMRAVINSCTAVGVQAALYTDRLISLGVDPERIRVTGQMKHDGVRFADTVEGADALRAEMKIGPDEPVLVAGSTGPGEEAILLDAFREVRKWHPPARLVLVPRRPETFNATAEAVLRADLGVRRRSTGEWSGSKRFPPVLLGDTMGEMLKWYALADIVFVGRSLVPVGGSNPMEAGALGKPLLWGPHMFNFPIEAPALLEAGAARVVTDAAGLVAAVDELLTRPAQCRQMGEAARATIRSLQGATRRSVDLVREALGGSGTPA